MAFAFDQRFRVEVPLDHPLALALRPSPKVVERIERLERVSAVGLQRVRNMLLGSDSPHAK
jgi:hypothetical protein